LVVRIRRAENNRDEVRWTDRCAVRFAAWGMA
jgi:hypothetical protein